MNRTVVFQWGAAVVVALLALYFVHGIYISGEPVLAALCLGAFALAVYVYTSTRARTYRYLFPGLAGITIFVVLPLVYTIGLGFTRYRSENFLTFERATVALLGETYVREGVRYRVSLHGDGDGFRLLLEPAAEQEEEGGDDSIFGEEGKGEEGGEEGEEGGDEGSIFDEEGEEGPEGEGGGGEGAAGEPGGKGEEGGKGEQGEEAGKGEAGGEGEPAGEEDSIFADDEGEEDSIFAEDAGSGDAGAAAQPDNAAGNAGAEAGGEVGDAPGAPAAGTQDDQAGQAGASAPARKAFVTERMALVAGAPAEVAAVPLDQVSGFQPGEPLPRALLIKHRDALQALTVRFPDGSWAVKDKLSLDAFLPQAQLYLQNPDGTLTNQKTGQVLTPSFDSGFYQTEAGEIVRPGFRTFVGLDNYVRIFTDQRMQEPFLRIFVWTVAFAGLTVLCTLLVGVVLAELMSWESLRFRALYQILLFLPYAVPGFISILVFKGLFNTSSGEINQILETVFGIRPDWFGDAFLARAMLLIVNTWLGYPYIMLLWMGLKKSVPGDLYEASALAGAGPLTNFFKITWPLVRKPITPLLISSFAFNFNNFVLIFLLTAGRPDFLDTSTPAGETDILVSYTYRIAFQDSGQNYGLAGAISTMIFLLVAVLSIINLRLTQVNQVEKR
jgi:maltose/maltodextrin transport system permease protein